jgi:hypothetical protein
MQKAEWTNRGGCHQEECIGSLSGSEIVSCAIGARTPGAILLTSRSAKAAIWKPARTAIFTPIVKQETHRKIDGIFLQQKGGP